MIFDGVEVRLHLGFEWCKKKVEEKPLENWMDCWRWGFGMIVFWNEILIWNGGWDNEGNGCSRYFCQKSS
jgi:hypothetical protein